MNEISIFTNPEFGKIRTVAMNGEPWFVGKDVAVALGYKDTAKALLSHVDGEDKHFVKVGEIPTLETGNYGVTIINESGLYSLILSSKLPGARAFKRWVTAEVLPQLRKTGTYGNINLEEIITKTAVEMACELTKALMPLLTEMTPAKSARPKKPAAVSNNFRQPSKIELLAPEIKKHVDEMLASEKYSCQQVANYIFNETGIYISTQSVTRYKRNKLMLE